MPGDAADLERICRHGGELIEKYIVSIYQLGLALYRVGDIDEKAEEDFSALLHDLMDMIDESVALSDRIATRFPEFEGREE